MQLPATVVNAICAVTKAAIEVRLHVESCHPCYRLSVHDAKRDGLLCSLPAVVVDTTLTLAEPDKIVRIPAESP